MKNKELTNLKVSHTHTPRTYDNYIKYIRWIYECFTPMSTLCARCAYHRYIAPSNMLSHQESISEVLPHKYRKCQTIFYFIFSLFLFGMCRITSIQEQLMWPTFLAVMAMNPRKLNDVVRNGRSGGGSVVMRWYGSCVCAEGRQCIIITIFIGMNNRIITRCECQEHETQKIRELKSGRV